MKIFLLWLVVAIIATLFCANAWLGCYLDTKWTGAVVCQGIVLLFALIFCGGFAIEETLT